MSKRVWVVGGGFLAGLVLVGGLYELNRLVSDYSALGEPSPANRTMSAAPLAEVPLDGELEGAPTEKAERRRLRRERRAAGAAEVTEGAPVLSDAHLQGVSAASVRMQLRPDQIAEASRPDVKAIRRRARLHRRGTRVAPGYEMGASSVGDRIPALGAGPVALEPVAPVEP